MDAVLSVTQVECYNLILCGECVAAASLWSPPLLSSVASPWLRLGRASSVVTPQAAKSVTQGTIFPHLFKFWLCWEDLCPPEIRAKIQTVFRKCRDNAHRDLWTLRSLDSKGPVCRVLFQQRWNITLNDVLWLGYDHLKPRFVELSLC